MKYTWALNAWNSLAPWLLTRVYKIFLEESFYRCTMLVTWKKGRNCLNCSECTGGSEYPSSYEFRQRFDARGSDSPEPVLNYRSHYETLITTGERNKAELRTTHGRIYCSFLVWISWMKRTRYYVAYAWVSESSTSSRLFFMRGGFVLTIK